MPPPTHSRSIWVCSRDARPSGPPSSGKEEGQGGLWAPGESRHGFPFNSHLHPTEEPCVSPPPRLASSRSLPVAWDPFCPWGGGAPEGSPGPERAGFRGETLLTVRPHPLPAVKIPVGGNAGVGDHDGLQVEVPVSQVAATERGGQQNMEGGRSGKESL